MAIIIIFAICILYNLVFFLSSVITGKEYLSIFGVTALCMDTGLMENEISKNALVLVKKVDKKELEIGDTIGYEVNGKIRINKIINFKKSYVTKSNQSYYPDIEEPEYEQIIGKKIASISFLGGLVKIIQSGGTTFLILILLILMIFYNRYDYLKQKRRGKKKAKRADIY